MSFFVSQRNFLLFHTGIELYSIIIGIMIYILSIYSYNYTKNCYFPFLGIAYLFVSTINLIHTLAYKGMNIFPQITANEPTQLWITARYIESISLALAPVFLYRKIKFSCVSFIYLIYAISTGILLAMIFYFKDFPTCYIEGVGLTQFKKISEYIISGILLLSAFILWKNKSALDDTVFSLITLSILATVVSELFFTLYISVYGVSNVIGHIFKFISFYLIGKALLEISLRAPYKTIFAELLKEADTFKDYIEYAGIMFLLLDRNGKVSLVNKMGSEVLGYPKDEIIGKDWFENFVPEYTRKELKDYYFKLMDDGSSLQEEYFENYIRTKKGDKVIRWHNSLLKDEKGRVIGVLSSGIDFTKEKELEERLTYYATIDELTGVYNKRIGLEIVRRELELATIRKSPVTIVFIDTDGLKMINDTFGHIEGDECLRTIAKVIKESIRGSDTVFRFGGDEFVIAFIQCNLDKAKEIMEGIVDKLSRITLELKKIYPLSISYGFSIFNPQNPLPLDELIIAADKDMYRMKRTGRDDHPAIHPDS